MVPYRGFLAGMDFRWYKGAIIAGVLTILYLPFTLNQRDLLYKSSELRASCEDDEYCRPNLLLLPVRLISPSGDGWSYLSPIDYLFSQGRYWEDYRMPGYGVIYGFFRLLTGDRDIAIWLLFLTQLLSWSIAAGLLSEELYRRQLPAFLILGVLILLSVSPAAYYVRVLVTESLTISFGLIAAVSLARRAYIIAGIFMTWVFFLRPVHVLWVGLGVVHLLLVERRLIPIALFLLPFILTEGGWILRNYLLYRDFRPFTGNGKLYYSFVYASSDAEIIDFLRYAGENDMGPVTRGGTLASMLHCHDFKPPVLAEVRRRLPQTWQGCRCSPESLHIAGILACELAHSPTYVIVLPESLYYSRGKALMPTQKVISSFHPSQRDCEIELRFIRILREFKQKIKACYEENLLKYIQNLVTHLLNLSYSGSPYDRQSTQGRLRIKMIYYGVYKWLYFISIALSLYVLLRGGPFERWVALSGLVIVAAYTVLGHLERRYMEGVGPFFLINLAFASHKLLVSYTRLFDKS